MRFLVLDTSSHSTSILIADEQACLSEKLFETKQNQSEVILPSIQDVCADASTTLGELDFFAVVVGPGSFTGLRVALSAIKGFSYALNKPILALDSLRLIADSMSAIMCAPTVFSRRGHVFGAIYKRTEQGLEIQLEAKEYELAFFESQSQLYGAELSNASVLSAEKIRQHVLKEYRLSKTIDAFGLSANYLITEVAKSKEPT